MQLHAPRPRPTGLHAGAPLSVVPSLPRIFELVGPEMAATEQALSELVGSTVQAIPEIGRYLVDAGGKRLRPLLTALGARAVGHTGDIIHLMCVGELLHLGSLLHDDVVDDGQERRGRPAAQRIYGNPAVILTGDFCLARAVGLAASQSGFKGVSELGDTITRMAEGEVLQLLRCGRVDADIDEYFEVIEKKSSALISWCAAAGAWATGQDHLGEALRAYGREVGIAFQITDDVLDYVGDVRATGKRRGQDLAEGKPTLPLVLAMERNPDLRLRLQKGAPSPERIPAILEEVRACGAAEAALATAHERVQKGIRALDPLPDGPYKTALIALGHHLVERVA